MKTDKTGLAKLVEEYQSTLYPTRHGLYERMLVLLKEEKSAMKKAQGADKDLITDMMKEMDYLRVCLTKSRHENREILKAQGQQDGGLRDRRCRHYVHPRKCALRDDNKATAQFCPKDADKDCMRRRCLGYGVSSPQSVEAQTPFGPASLVEAINQLNNATKKAIENMTGESEYINPEVKGHYRGCMETYVAFREELEEILSAHRPEKPTSNITPISSIQAINIRFRGKRKEKTEYDGKWVYGFFFKTPLTVENFDPEHFGNSISRSCIADENGVVYEVHPDSIEWAFPSAYPVCPNCGDDGYWICPECEKKFTPKDVKPTVDKGFWEDIENETKYAKSINMSGVPVRAIEVILSRHPQSVEAQKPSTFTELAMDIEAQRHADKMHKWWLSMEGKLLKVVNGKAEEYKPINPVVAAHEAAQGPLRTAIWELVEEMEANSPHMISSGEMVGTLKSILLEKVEQKPLAHASFQDYDAGLLSDYGGGNVTWWMDYIRVELERCNEHWREQLSAYQAEKSTADKFADKNCYICALYQECKIPHMTGWYGCNKFTPASPEKSTQGQGDKGENGLTNYIGELEQKNNLRANSKTGIIRKHYSEIIHRLKQIANYTPSFKVGQLSQNCKYNDENSNCILPDNSVCAMGFMSRCAGTVPSRLKRSPPSPDTQTQVQQLIQWAKDNGYGLAAEWMEKRK